MLLVRFVSPCATLKLIIDCWNQVCYIRLLERRKSKRYETVTNNYIPWHQTELSVKTSVNETQVMAIEKITFPTWRNPLHEQRQLCHSKVHVTLLRCHGSSEMGKIIALWFCVFKIHTAYYGIRVWLFEENQSQFWHACRVFYTWIPHHGTTVRYDGGFLLVAHSNVCLSSHGQRFTTSDTAPTDMSCITVPVAKSHFSIIVDQ